jgi:hypothetical protein
VDRSWHAPGAAKPTVTPSSSARSVARRPAALAVLLLLAGCGGGDQPDNAAFDAALRDARPAEVTVTAAVTRLLADSPNHGDGVHQRFDVSVDGTEVEIDHNLSLAGRVPVTVGSTVVIHGQFEPDPGHPVIHYTHHATGRHEGGWIELQNTRYD